MMTLALIQNIIRKNKNIMIITKRKEILNQMLIKLPQNINKIINNKT